MINKMGLVYPILKMCLNEDVTLNLDTITDEIFEIEKKDGCIFGKFTIKSNAETMVFSFDLENQSSQDLANLLCFIVGQGGKNES